MSFLQNSAVRLLPIFRRLWPDFVIYTKLRSIDIERSTPKFLKNWETQLFQKLAGVGSRRLIPTRNLLIASWYNLLTMFYAIDCSGRAQPTNSVGLAKLTFCKWLSMC